MKKLTKSINRFTGLIIVSIVFILMLNINLCFGISSIRLISVKFIQTPGVESIELLLNSQPDFATFKLQNPDRFVLDIKRCYFSKIRDVINPDSKYIKKIRISQFRQDSVRLVIDQKIITQISIQKKELLNGTVLTLSIQLPELAEVEKNNIKSLVTFEPSQKNEIDKFKEAEDKAIESKTVVDIQSKTSHVAPDENLDTLFNVPEDGANAIPDIIPHETTMNDQSDSIIDQSSKLSIDGDLRNETAYRLDKPHHLSKVKNTLNLKASGDLSSNLSYVMGSRFSYDAVFDLTDDYNNNVENDQRLRADLRDAYFDFGLGNFDLRLGNQQIAWGQAVGLFFADIVNPKDLKEYILPDLDQVRIPLFAANMEYYYNSIYLQMIFIPFPEFNEFGKTGSEFDFSKQLYNQNADIILNDPQEPPDSLDNSEIGFRISTLTDGWDYSLFYLYDYNNFPVNYRAISLNPPGSQHPVTITYLPKYERIHRVGSTFSKEVMDAIVKGEFIYSNTMFFQSSDTSDLDGIKKSDTFDWLLGFDYTFFNSLESNFQLMQSIILDHENTMTQKEATTSFSIWLKTGFFENLIEPELFFVSSMNQTDYLLRPKITYNYNDAVKFVLGTDIFYGETDGAFGIFDENDRVYLNILYNF